MERNSLALVVIACALVAPAAQACKPLVPAERIREFVATPQTSSAIIFTGKVVSVNEKRQTDGAVVIETTLQPTQWWMHFHNGPVVVRTTSLAMSPCPDFGVLHAGAGEQWLVSGWLHNTVAGSWVELSAGMRLENGRLPGNIKQELLRVRAAD